MKSGLDLRCLVECCRELRDWSTTGRLKQDGIFKTWMETHQELQRVSNHHRLAVAEAVISKEALEKLVELYDKGVIQ